MFTFKAGWFWSYCCVTVTLLVTLSVCVMLKFYYFAGEVHAYTSLNSTITETEIMDLQLKNEGSSHQLMPGFIFETTVWFTFKSNFSQPLFLI